MRSRASTRRSTRRCPRRRRPTRLPRAWRERWGLRRYGFHGLSHAWAARRAASCAARGRHAAISAPARRWPRCATGARVDTTMGFTPLEGLVMATRSGSVDPGLLLWLLEEHGDAPSASSPRRSSTSRACWRWRAPRTCARCSAGASAATPTRPGAATSTCTGCAPGSPRWRRRSAASTPWSSPAASASAALRCDARAAAGLGFLGVALDPARNATAAATPTSAPRAQRCGRSSSKPARTSRSRARSAPW